MEGRGGGGGGGGEEVEEEAAPLHEPVRQLFSGRPERLARRAGVRARSSRRRARSAGLRDAEEHLAR